MQYLTFNNGHKMPVLGLGTFLANIESESEAAVNKALELGYRHFDTAYFYRNEHVLGKVLKEWLSSGKIKREELFITTKLPPIGLNKDKVEHFLNLSLTALQLDYVDLYLIHNPVGFEYVSDTELVPFSADMQIRLDMSTDLLAVWKKMEEQVDAGKTKSIGISNFNEAQIERIVKAARIQPANHQIEVYAYFQQKEMLAFCKKLGITVVAYGPFGSPGRGVMGPRGGKEFVAPPVLEDPVVAEVAKKHGKTISQVLLRHLIQLGVAPIPKSTNPERIAQNFQVFDFELDGEDLKKLTALDQGEDGRSFKMDFLDGLDKHPEFPLKRS